MTLTKSFRQVGSVEHGRMQATDDEGATNDESLIHCKIV